MSTVLRARGITATIVAAAWLLFCIASPIGAEEGLLSKGPYIQAPGETTMTIMWETRTPVPVTVRYGRGDRLDQALAVAPPRVMQAISPVSRTNALWSTKTNVLDDVTNTVSGFTTNTLKR